MKKYFFLLVAIASANIVLGQVEEAFSSMVKYRNIGPFRGGRSVAASGVVQDPLTYYMGTTGGGLWKTEDAGQHWNNVSDGFFNTGSVGAVAGTMPTQTTTTTANQTSMKRPVVQTQ